ncbi:DUF262 domain-containing protein [Bacillus gobiensis]|uniref:DUF262 domain-containing protein n=1 Tax=Bacillus gobiensis TaxID=1441095 RepID=UPI003D232EC1
MEIKNNGWAVKQLVRMSEKGTLRFDYPIQRSAGQWKLLQKSYLIHSLAQNYPIPPVYFLGLKENVMVEKKGKTVEEEITVRYVLDGKQRITVMKEFIEDDFALDPDTPEVTIDGEEFDIAEKTFGELEESVQDMILSRTILTYTLDGQEVSDEEIEDLFFRMNNGSALTEQQKSKAKMGVAWATRLSELGDHTFIRELSAFSKTQIKSDSHLTAIVQTMMMLDGDYDYKNVSQRVVSQYAATLRDDNGRKLELFNKVKEAMDFLSGVFDKKESKLLKKVHWPMVVMTAIYAMEQGYDQEKFYSWSQAFKKAINPKGFSKTDVPTDYLNYTGKGTTDRKMADGRMVEMKKHFYLFTELVLQSKN